MGQSMDSGPTRPETAILDTEARRIEIDAELRRADLAERRAQRESEERRHALDNDLKVRELQLASGRGLHFTSAQATVVAAALALASAAFGGLIQAWAARNVEATKNAALIEIEKVKAEGTEKLDREKFETSLIMKAIETPGRDDQIRNLQFFLAAGFIKDPEGKIKNISLSDYPSSPVALSSLASQSNDFSGLDSRLVAFLTKWEGTTPNASILRLVLSEVEKAVTVPLNGNQLTALASLAYNIGTQPFKRSSLVSHLNGGDLDAAAKDFSIWNKIGGRELPTLTQRREAEAALFRLPVESASAHDGGTHATQSPQ